MGRLLARLLLPAIQLLLICACAKRPPNLLLITIDTLRADRLGAYGSTVSTPNIDRLAREGLLFENVVAPLPETRPSHASLFTSAYPRQHGVVSNKLELADEALTLAEVLQQAGYQTAAFVGCRLFDRESGLQQGFQLLDLPKQPQRQAAEVVTSANQWLAGADRPFFVWLHLFDPHMPYQPPPPFNLGPGLTSFHWQHIYAITDDNDGDLPSWALQRALQLYDGEVAYVDHWLGHLFAGLEARRQWRHTITVLAADHGECFGGGVFFDHSHCLGEGALAVPLIIRAPGQVAAGARSQRLVELIDVAPTLLELCRLDVPQAYAGVSLLQPGDGRRHAFFQHPMYDDASIADRVEVLQRLRSVAGEPTLRVQGDLVQFGVRRGGVKYLRIGDQEHLYQIDEDPEELHDLAHQQPAVVAALRTELYSWLRQHPLELPQPEQVNPQLIENLRALGYLGQTPPP